jgi:hypothetical protein
LNDRIAVAKRFERSEAIERLERLEPFSSDFTLNFEPGTLNQPKALTPSSVGDISFAKD